MNSLINNCIFQKSIKLFFILFMSAHFVQSQEAVSNIEQTIADIFEQFAEESEDEFNYEDYFEELLFFTQNPIRLNSTTREELEKLPFLSAVQVENILAYRYFYGNIYTIYELQLIEGLDMTDIRRILPFVTVDKTQKENEKWYWKDALKYGKNEIFLRFDKGLEQKKAYVSDAEDGSKKYRGNNLYNSLKYRYNYKNNLQIGITAEKDAGEQFWGEHHKGYDFYSAYVQINNLGPIKSAVLGDYRINFGQGLVVRTDFSMGKSSYVLNVLPRNSGIKKYSSTNEADYFRGFAAAFDLGKFELTAFYSNKMIDGDTVNGTFSSIYKTGLHRTENEFKRKHTVNHQLAGGNITFNHENLQIGASAVATFLDHTLQPDVSTYNHYYFSGNKQIVAGIHYRLRWQKLNLFGETAVTIGNSSFSTINGVLYSPLSLLSLLAVYRYYSPEYDNFYANALSETSRINNEKGVYLGAETRPFRYWKFSLYADVFYFPWIKYGIESPSTGTDYLLQADYTARKDLNMFWRLRYKSKMQNVSGSQTTLQSIAPNEKLFLRYNLNYQYGRFQMKNIIEGNIVKKANNSQWTYGLTALQDISYSFRKTPLRFDLRFQIFDAENYDNRIYSYEKDILYAFSIPMYYGIGCRYYLNLRYELNKYLSFWFKIAQTVYADDRDYIGTGNEQINGNRKTDIRFLLRWKF